MLREIAASVALRPAFTAVSVAGEGLAALFGGGSGGAHFAGRAEIECEFGLRFDFFAVDSWWIDSRCEALAFTQSLFACRAELP